MTAPAADREGFAAFLLRLRALGVTSKSLVAAFESVPRHAFMANRHAAIAWSDRMVPIGCGEAIQGVDTQALVLSQLAVEPSHRVLEIGTGTGYTAAVLARLAARVLTIERWKRLQEKAATRFQTLGLANVVAQYADGSHGASHGDGPFDRIVVWGAFNTMPRHARRDGCSDWPGRRQADIDQAYQGRKPV